MKNVLVMIALKDGSKSLFYDIEGYDYRFVLPKNVTDEDLEWAEIIVGQPTDEQIAKAPHLKWIQTSSAGVNSYLDLKEGILLSNAYGAYGPGIAEYLTACVLAAEKNLYGYDALQKEHLWKDLPYGPGIPNMNILSIGMGSIGSEFLKRMHALGAACYGVKRHPGETPDYAEAVYSTEEVDEILPEMDVVALSLPETPDTVKFLDSRRLPLLKKGSILLNVGRGTAIDTDALVKNAGRFREIFLDVTDPEPLPKDHPLWDLHNVHITPHISGRYMNPLHYHRVLHVILSNLRNAKEGKPLLHTVSRSLGY